MSKSAKVRSAKRGKQNQKVKQTLKSLENTLEVESKTMVRRHVEVQDGQAKRQEDTDLNTK